MSVNIFIFRRDLRVFDNQGLANLLEHVKQTSKQDVLETKVIPIFIFNKLQVIPTLNKYYSKNCVEFMVQSITSLNNQLNGKLQLFETDDDIKPERPVLDIVHVEPVLVLERQIRATGHLRHTRDPGLYREQPPMILVVFLHFPLLMRPRTDERYVSDERVPELW